MKTKILTLAACLALCGCDSESVRKEKEEKRLWLDSYSIYQCPNGVCEVWFQEKEKEAELPNIESAKQWREERADTMTKFSIEFERSHSSKEKPCGKRVN